LQGASVDAVVGLSEAAAKCHYGFLASSCVPEVWISGG
jgi:hypothetical protein